jgi:hypothetical protein
MTTGEALLFPLPALPEEDSEEEADGSSRIWLIPLKKKLVWNLLSQLGFNVRPPPTVAVHTGAVRRLIP